MNQNNDSRVLVRSVVLSSFVQNPSRQNYIELCGESTREIAKHCVVPSTQFWNSILIPIGRLASSISLSVGVVSNVLSRAKWQICL